MNREEIRKKWKNKEFVEITNSKPNLSSNERNYVKPVSNDMWSNVMSRANQMLSNTTVNIKNTNNLVKVEKPLLNASKIYTITEEQAKNIANIEDSKKRFEEISKISNNRQQYQQNAIKVNQIRETEKNKKKAEKINQNIKEGNYLSSLGHVLSGLPKEAMNAVTKTTLSLANLNPNTKNSKEMMEAGKILTSNYSDTTSQIDNKIIQGASRVSGTIGNMIPSIATNLMGGPAGLVNAINAGTSSYMENLNEEQNNKLKSTLTGLGKGTLSYYIEKLSGGNFLGKGSLDDLAKQGISKIKSDVGKKIASKVYEVGGEIAEENLENITGYVVDKLINNKDITMEQFVSDLKQTTGDTAITTLVLSALGLGGNTYQEIKAMELNQQQDLINNSGLSDLQKQKLEEVAQKYDLSEKDIQDLIDNTKNGKYTENQVTTMQNNEVINQNEQVILPQDKTAQNSVSQQNNSNNEYKAILPGSNYKFEASGNQKIDNLRQDASKYYNNSKKARDLISSMEKIIADKDYSIRLDNTITDARENFVNGKITKEKGETIITINPDSNRAFEFIIGHEVGHAITTPEMKKLVIDFASKNKEFSKSIESLKQTYNTNEITDEVISDIEGQLLGNQDFINSLSVEKPSIFKQIYDVIISIANKITGNSNEALFIRDLKNKYQKAYREIQGSNVIEGKESYSKETTSDGIEYIKSEQNLFTKEDGSAMTPIEAYNSLVGKTIDFGDGDSAYILKRLPGKNLYDELFKRYPKFLKNISDAKKLNADVNNNIVELLENSKNINPNEPDVLNRHIKQGITNFDTRIVNFYDGNNAYQIEFSIAKLNDGKKVAYAKKFFGLDKDLTQKIKVDEAMGNKSQLNQQPLLNNSIPSSKKKVNTTEYSMQENKNNTENSNKSSFSLLQNHKQQQLEIIQNSNPMLDDYHAGIRSIEDIKTLSETLLDSDWADYEEFNPDLTKKMLEEAIENGEITVYSSYPIEQGTFISPSKMEAESYSENGKVYEKTVKIKDIAWIDPTQGQYANVENKSNKEKYSKPNETWQEYLESNFKAEGTRTYKEDVRLPERNQVKIDSENFSKQIDEVKNGTFPKRDMLTLLTQTPKALLDIGLSNFPITMTQKHLDTIMNKEGKNTGANYHDLGENIIKQLPEAINNSLDIVESSTKDDSIVLTTYLSDNQNRSIIASIKIDGTGKVNNIEVDSNVMTSAYGRNNYEKWMQENIDSGRLLYDIDRGVIKKVTRSRLQLPRTSNFVDTVDNVSTSNNIIPQNDINMQQPKKISEVFPKQDKRRIVDEVYVDELNEGKIRKHYKSVFESDQVGDVGKDVAKELLKQDTYVPISNLETITSVNENINRNGIGATYNAFTTKMRSNERITLQDVATGERLIQIYSQQGDYDKVNELIQDVAILGTELGQQVQALSLIKKASPEGQLQYLTKMLERTNIKENTDIKITNEMAEKILSSKNQEELEQNLSKLAVEIADQLPITAKDKIHSWRYLSMLGNPKTHIKNIGANVAMNVTQRTKNIVAGTIEDFVSVFNQKMERTKTLKPANKEQRDFAGQDAEYMKDLIDAGGKYDVKNVIQNSKRQFDNRVLNTIAEFNSELLDKEDKIFLKSAYKMALQNYMSANNLKASDMEGKTLEKARQYASLQAQEATFHEFNAVANTLSQLENKGGIVGGATSAILPFKKTPMNIAKAGIQYSPIGLAKSVTYDISQIIDKTDTYKQQLEDGKITQEQYNSETSKLVNKTIDNMAKGLTGTSIAILGYALAKMGVLKAGNDEEDDEFKEKLGEQEYSIKIGDDTYTLDWVSPSAIPLFTGATIYQLATGNEEEQKSIINSTLTAFSKTFEPMTDMSMLQGLTSAITSYEQGSSNMIFDLGASMATSYAGQFVPTALGQVARTVDPYERDNSTTKKGIEGKIDRFARQTINKIPGASQKLPTKKDVWGEEVKRPENIVQRGLENAVLPWTRKKLTEDRTAKELLKVFDETGENVLPRTPSKDLTINKEKYRMTTDEYNQAKQDFGQTSKKLLDDLFKSNTYNALTSEGKAKAIDDIYAYAKEKLKVDYAEKKNEEIKTSTLYNTVTKLQEQKADVSAYFEFKGKIDDLDTEKGDEEVKKQEKIEYLQDMKTSSKTKRIIYEETLGTTDKTYKYLSQLTGNKVEINQYLDYKTTEIKGDDNPDSNVKGKTLSGSKKKKIVNYLNNSDFSPVERLYIYGTQYSFDSNQKAKFKSYIDKAKQEGKINSEEATEIYKKLRNVEELEDGKIRWK